MVMGFCSTPCTYLPELTDRWVGQFLPFLMGVSASPKAFNALTAPWVASKLVNTLLRVSPVT